MIDITGDFIEFNGDRVAVFRADVLATVRENFEHALRHDVDDLLETNGELQFKLDDATTRVTQLEGEVKALRVMLGLKP